MFNRVRWFLDFLIGYRINSDIVFAVPAECSHRSMLFGVFAFVDAEHDTITPFSAPTRDYLAAATFIADFANCDSF